MTIRQNKVLFMLWIAFSGIAMRGDIPPYKAGDIICYLGDSITKQGGYHSEIQLFYVTRYPDQPMVSWNCGLAGNMAKDMLKRYQWDAMSRNPTVVCIMAGMNDVNRGLYSRQMSSHPEIAGKRDEAIARHLDNMDQLIDSLTQKNVRIILLTPSIYDQTGTQKATCNFGVCDALDKCAAGVRQLSEKYNTKFIEFTIPMKEINLMKQKVNPDFTIVGPDRIHPGAAGHMFMAWLFLKSQNVLPVVSEMVIDVAKKSVIKQNNCDISGLRVDDTALSFDCLEKALPFPLDAKNEKILSLIPFCHDLNMEKLCIKGLAKGEYELRIDGVKIMKISADGLMEGINLATQKNTPQYKQALQVKKVLSRRFRLENKLRDFVHVKYMYYADLNNPSAEEIRMRVDMERKKLKGKKDIWSNYCLRLIDSYDKMAGKENDMEREMDALLKQAYRENKPCSHHYELRLLKNNNSKKDG